MTLGTDFGFTPSYEAPKFVHDFSTADNSRKTVPWHKRWELKNTGPLLEVLRHGAFPEVAQKLHAVLESVDRLRAIEDTVVGGVEQLAERTVEAALAGTVVSEDFLTEAAAAEVEAREFAAARMAVAVVRERLTLKLSKIVDQSADELLDEIRDRVEAALNDGRRALIKLDGLDPTDAEATATASAGQRKALTELKPAREAYELARLLQQVVLTSISDEQRARHGLPRTANSMVREAMGFAEFSAAATSGTLGDKTPGSAERFVAVLQRTDVVVPSLRKLGASYQAATSGRRN